MATQKISIDLSKEINEIIRVSKNEQEKKNLEKFGHFDALMLYAGAKVDGGLGGKVIRQIDSLKELRNIKPKLKNIKILVFEIPKVQADLRLSNGKSVLNEIKDEIKRHTTYFYEESGAVRKRKGKERFPFKVEVKVV